MCGVILVATLFFPREPKEKTSTIVTAVAAIVAGTTGKMIDFEACNETAAAAAAGSAIKASVATSTTPSLLYNLRMPGANATTAMRSRRASTAVLEKEAEAQVSAMMQEKRLRRASSTVYEKFSSPASSLSISRESFQDSNTSATASAIAATIQETQPKFLNLSELPGKHNSNNNNNVRGLNDDSTGTRL